MASVDPRSPETAYTSKDNIILPTLGYSSAQQTELQKRAAAHDALDAPETGTATTVSVASAVVTKTRIARGRG